MNFTDQQTPADVDAELLKAQQMQTSSLQGNSLNLVSQLQLIWWDMWGDAQALVTQTQELTAEVSSLAISVNDFTIAS